MFRGLGNNYIFGNMEHKTFLEGERGDGDRVASQFISGRTREHSTPLPRASKCLIDYFLSFPFQKDPLARSSNGPCQEQTQFCCIQISATGYSLE